MQYIKALGTRRKRISLTEGYKMNLESRARLPWLDVLKGIGIILVVVGHIYSNKTIFNWLYSFHMPLFFFAAGWVYCEKPILVL